MQFDDDDDDDHDDDDCYCCCCCCYCKINSTIPFITPLHNKIKKILLRTVSSSTGKPHTTNVTSVSVLATSQLYAAHSNNLNKALNISAILHAYKITIHTVVHKSKSKEQLGAIPIQFSLTNY